MVTVTTVLYAVIWGMNLLWFVQLAVDLGLGWECVPLAEDALCGKSHVASSRISAFSGCVPTLSCTGVLCCISPQGHLVFPSAL